MSPASPDTPIAHPASRGDIPREQQRAFLLRLARQEMIRRGLEPDFPPEALAEAESLVAPGPPFETSVRDLRSLAWCSIDNDDSRDLDQLTLATPLADGGVTVMVAVADVSILVTPDSAVDAHAAVNTTSIYTPPRNFHMLPERLSRNSAPWVPEKTAWPWSSS